LIEDYLRRAKGNVAQATWMAADLLGDHWELSESLPLLEDIALSGKSISAREAAIHGLSKALGRATKPQYRRINSTLERLSFVELNAPLRLAAQLAQPKVLDAWVES